MSLVYSERFVGSQGTGAGASWMVPAGKRAVIRCVASVQGGAVAGFAYVTAGPQTLWIRDFPAQRLSVEQEFRAVVYAGEFIGCYTHAVEQSVQCHGYLFDDTTARAQQLPVAPVPPPVPGPSPWEYLAALAR